MADPDSIYHWHRIDERITTSGQPTEMQLSALASMGVRTVINLGLHTHERALPDERSSVAALGMNYVHIPVDFRNPTEGDFQSFCSAITASGDRPLHVHCIANYRVSAFFYRYRCSLLHMATVQARADLERVWQPDVIWDEFIRRSE